MTIEEEVEKYRKLGVDEDVLQKAKQQAEKIIESEEERQTHAALVRAVEQSKRQGLFREDVDL